MDKVWVGAIDRGMHGTWSHPDLIDLLEDVDFKLAGRTVDGLPHSIWQLTRHIIEWGWVMVNSLKGQQTKSPQEEDNNFFPSDPTPSDADTWNSHKMALEELISEMVKVAEKLDPTITFPEYDNISGANVMIILLSHNSYHTAQIVQIKRLLDK